MEFTHWGDISFGHVRLKRTPSKSGFPEVNCFEESAFHNRASFRIRVDYTDVTAEDSSTEYVVKDVAISSRERS